MPEKLSLKQGTSLVNLARKSMDYSIASGMRLIEQCGDKMLLEPRGVFVTLHSFPERDLRGCIGMPYPLRPLWNSVSEMAVEASLKDPRFPPMETGDVGNVIVEVSVLTRPEEILCERKKLPKFVKIGEDGLIVQRGNRSGLLLPQVATEQKWDSEEFLRQCCVKAGLMESMWQSTETKIFKFQAQIFSEVEPKGEIEEKKN